MNVLFQSPLGALLAKPWVDPAGLFGLRRWYMPLSRLWAAANAAGEDVALFRDQVGAPAGLLVGLPLAPAAGHHDRLRLAAEAARAGMGSRDLRCARQLPIPALLDRRRRAAATRHLMTRAAFYPLLFPRRPPPARWQIDPPDERRSVPRCRSALYGVIARCRHRSRCRGRSCSDGLREYWLRAPTPSARLRSGPAARRCMPASSSRPSAARRDADLRQRPLPRVRPAGAARTIRAGGSRRWAGG